MKDKFNNSDKIELSKQGTKVTGKRYKSDWEKSLYFKVLCEFEINSNLPRIRNKLKLSKSHLNYYTRKLCDSNHLKKIEDGWYEVIKKDQIQSTKVTKYGGTNCVEEIRGHAFVWEVKFKSIPTNWNNRIEVLKKYNTDYVLVGALKTTPRILIEKRKVWLCKNKLRIFDIEKASYFGETALNSRKKGLGQAIRILKKINNKFGTNLKSTDITFQKEHYALINNELAKKYNSEGEKLSVVDEDGEWLLVDDSMGDGGEIENVGKSAFKTSPKVQNWYNDHKKHNFEVTSSFILENVNTLADSQKLTQSQLNELMLVTRGLLKTNELLQQEILKLKER